MKTTEEIKALISEKIAGQGTQVDLGGALPEILNALVAMNEQLSFVTISQNEISTEGSGIPIPISEDRLQELRGSVAATLEGQNTVYIRNDSIMADPYIQSTFEHEISDGDIVGWYAAFVSGEYAADGKLSTGDVIIIANNERVMQAIIYHVVL